MIFVSLNTSTMSNFEIGQLKHYLKSAYNQRDMIVKRNEYTIYHLRALASGAVWKEEWTHEERGEYANLVSNWVDFMKVVEFERIPEWTFNKKLLNEFISLHSQWIKEDNDMGFIEWLNKDIEDAIEE